MTDANVSLLDKGERARVNSSSMFSDVESFPEMPIMKKTNKPLMEKKRRARINRCLAELKDILIKDNHVSASHAKWEKADILEMTVDYVKKMRSVKGIHDVKRPLPIHVEDLDDSTSRCKSPASVCSPPSTSSSTEFSIDAPEAKRRRRSDQEPGLPHAPIPTYQGGFTQQYLAQQLFLANLHQTSLKMATVAPVLPLPTFTTGTIPSVSISGWR